MSKRTYFSIAIPLALIIFLVGCGQLEDPASSPPDHTLAHFLKYRKSYGKYLENIESASGRYEYVYNNAHLLSDTTSTQVPVHTSVSFIYKAPCYYRFHETQHKVFRDGIICDSTQVTDYIFDASAAYGTVLSATIPHMIVFPRKPRNHPLDYLGGTLISLNMLDTKLSYAKMCGCLNQCREMGLKKAVLGKRVTDDGIVMTLYTGSEVPPESGRGLEEMRLTIAPDKGYTPLHYVLAYVEKNKNKEAIIEEHIIRLKQYDPGIWFWDRIENRQNYGYVADSSEVLEHIIEIKELTFNIDIPDASFEVRTYQLPPDAIVFDYTDDPEYTKKNTYTFEELLLRKRGLRGE
jgi:predicted small secreted protein